VRRSAANAPVRHGRDDDADRRARAAREREWRERERVESLTSGAGLTEEARRAKLGRLGRGRRGGETRARRGLGQNWPSRGGGFFLFLFLFSISFHFLLLFLFISFSFESIIF
jgi:hypothetical protein